MTAVLHSDATSTQHVNLGTQHVSYRSRHPVDAGNRFVKWFSPRNQPQMMLSCIKKLEEFEPDFIPTDDRSVLIEWNANRYLIGEVAQELGGKSVYNRDKSELASLLSLVTFEPMPGQGEILIDTLPIALPDARNQTALKNLKRLQGQHSFKRNGETVTVQVNRVEPITECLAAWKWAFRHGVFQYRRNNAVIDFGGGTLLARVITASGVIDWTSEAHLDGTFALANQVGAAIKPRLGKTPDNAAIMNAIADGSFIYSNIPFQGDFEKVRTDWIDGVRAALKECWSSQLHQIGEVLIVGGSAPLLKPLADSSNGRFKIASHDRIPNFHQFISLYGMLEA